MYHNPVLLQESIKGLAIQADGIYVDVTFGGGGHSREILKKLKNGKLYAFDQDEEAQKNIWDDERLIFVDANFRFLKNFLKFYNALPVDGILADLGVSSHQFDEALRGFSTRFEGELDMRMDKKNRLTAKQVINSYSENDLYMVFRNYGEIHNAAALSKRIIQERKNKEIITSEQLKKIASRFTRKGTENQYLARVYQAIRIEVNKELDVLKTLLNHSLEVLKTEGRIAVISYHSLEDRLVKNFFKSGNFEGEIKKDFYGNVLSPLKVITKKPIVPGQEEIEQNNRARSAKLRIAEKI